MFYSKQAQLSGNVDENTHFDAMCIAKMQVNVVIVTNAENLHFYNLLINYFASRIIPFLVFKLIFRGPWEGGWDGPEVELGETVVGQQDLPQHLRPVAPDGPPRRETTSQSREPNLFSFSKT